MGDKTYSPKHRRLSKSEISPGDHIYTSRAGGVYGHHGIYVGEDHVIHFQNSLDDKMLGSSLQRGPCPKCGHHSGNSGVVESCLGCFLRGGRIGQYEYGFRALLMPLGLMKICTLAACDAPETVIDRALNLLMSTNGFGDYDLLHNNCEDFALFCKTGECIRSGQVTFLKILPVALFGVGLLTVSVFFAPHLFPYLTLGALLLCLFPHLTPAAAFDALRRKKTSSKYKS